MGMYDIINFTDRTGEEKSIQIKAAVCNLDEYKIGDKIDLPDGIYIGNHGTFTVFYGNIVAAFSKKDKHLFDHFGNILYPNPCL